MNVNMVMFSIMLEETQNYILLVKKMVFGGAKCLTVYLLNAQHRQHSSMDG